MKTSTKTFAIADTAANADYLTNTSEPLGETMTLNVGPSHPATHGVLRLVLELDGEEIISCDPVVGHLHRGMEKIGETIQDNQFVPYTDRFDYLAPLANNIAYAAHGSNVKLNMCRGRVIYENGEFLTIDREKTLREVREYAIPLLFGK